MATPSSSGIGAPGTAPAPANLSRSPMASVPSQQQPQAIPFTRGSTLATMKDATLSALAAGSTTQVQLQTNAFLESLILDVSVTTSGNSATVKWQADAPFNIIAQIKLDDPAGQSIVAPITGFQLYTLNKYLLDTDMNFDPARDAGFSMLPTAANNGSGSSAGTAGSAYFRLVVPVEHRRRDALGALNNSAANQRYLLTITTAASYAAGADTANNVYLTSSGPTTAPTVGINIYQQYWTAPPAVITTSSGSTQVQATPTGLGTVAFVRYERHNEVSGGGQPQIQLNNVGDYIANIVWTLRLATNNARDAYTAGNAANTGYANWPAEFDFWENDFQVHALSQDDWIRWMSRFYNLTSISAQAGNPGTLDAGVFSQFQLSSLFDDNTNFAPANQYLPTDATTKLQVRGSTFGSSSSYLEVVTRMIRPVSGAALFA